MRLLQLLPGAYIGGIERYGLAIGLAAASEGWDVHSAFPHTEDTADLISAFHEGGVTTHPFDHRASGPSVWTVAAATRRTTRILARVRPSVAHVNIPIPGFARNNLIGCALRGVPTVAVFHTAPPDRREAGRSKPLYPLLRARSQAWVTVSEHDRGGIAKTFGVPAEELTVIRNGIAPPPPGDPSEEERAEVRRELGLPASGFLALSVGRLNRQKGYDYLIALAAKAARRFPQVSFVIAGEGEARAELEALIREHRLGASVHLVGQRNDVTRLLRASDLFIFPSRFEGFPFALLEAAAAGLPIIAADVGGANEIVTHRDSGLLHRSGDTEALWHWFEFAVENTAEMDAMGRRAKLAVSKFSHDEMVRSTLALLAAQATSNGRSHTT